MKEHVNRSPYAVLCNHGSGGEPERCYLTHQDYHKQLRHCNEFWTCPVCGSAAKWDYVNSDLWLEGCHGSEVSGSDDPVVSKDELALLVSVVHDALIRSTSDDLLKANAVLNNLGFKLFGKDADSILDEWRKTSVSSLPAHQFMKQ